MNTKYWDAEEIYAFAKESNEIENIHSEERHKDHAIALTEFLDLDEISIGDLTAFVSKVQPGTFLRTAPDHNVWIGGHQAAPAHISLELLNNLLLDIKEKKNLDAWDIHCKYEIIHPFLDVNGRSGRCLWAWMMLKYHNYYGDMKFLRMFYYQTLQHYRKVKNEKR